MKRPIVEQLLYIVLVLLFVVTSIGVYFFATQLHFANKKNTELQQAVQELKDNEAKNTQKINDHVDCIGLFLRQTNRQDLTIVDLDNCQLDRAGTQTSLMPQSQPSDSVTPSPTTTTQDTPPKRSFVSPGIDFINKVLKGVGL